MAQPKDLQALIVVLGNLVHVRPGMVLQRGEEYLSLLWRYELARRHYVEGREKDVLALTTPSYWSENDPDGKTVIWMTTKKGPRVWAAEPGSNLVPAAEKP